MIKAIPADIILHIFSYLPLSDVCLLMKKTRNSDPLLQFYLKRDLLTRVKREEWDIVLHSPATYFAILCNRHVSALVKPIAELTCTSYNSQSEYLRFETLNSYEMEISDEEIEFQSIRIYCSQWFNLSKEDDKNVQIKLVWRQGDQTKQIGDMFINYKCTKKESAEGCDQCKYCHRCRRHAFLSTPTNTQLKILQIQSIRVSLNWLQQGLIF
jgi:hypothetical protein